MNSTLVLDANHFASDAHRGQFRRYTRDPYIVHPEAVARWVGMVTDDPETIAAAWLHDVLEDTAVNLQEIKVKFGDVVAGLVLDVTNVATCGNRAYRKSMERAHLRQADPRAKTIKLADILDNVPSIIRYDPNFAKIYVAEKRLLLGGLWGGHEYLWYCVDKMLENYGR